MSFEVMLAVLASAAMHAAWNALVRAAADKFLDTALVVACAGLLALPLFAFTPPPAAASWSWLAASALIHVLYFALVARAYRHGELAFAYPLMRGTAPALSAVLVLLVIGESPSAGGWGGVALVCGGVLLLAGEAWHRGRWHGATARVALANAVVIACYTLIDASGARASGNAAAYTGWMFLLTGLGLAALALGQRGGEAVRYWRARLPHGLGGGLFTLASYSLALWAMTRAPVALVAALRETSVVFAGLIAVFVLRERVGRWRAASICTVACGAAAIKLF